MKTPRDYIGPHAINVSFDLDRDFQIDISGHGHNYRVLVMEEVTEDDWHEAWPEQWAYTDLEYAISDTMRKLARIVIDDMCAAFLATGKQEATS